MLKIDLPFGVEGEVSDALRVSVYVATGNRLTTHIHREPSDLIAEPLRVDLASKFPPKISSINPCPIPDHYYSIPE